MIDSLYALCRDVFQLVGLPFIIIYALRLMVGAKAPDLIASLIKPMFKFMARSLRWFWKETWKLSGNIAQEVTKSAPVQYRPHLKSATRVLICFALFLAASKILR